MLSAKEVAALAAKALDAKMGEDIRLIGITDISTLADFFLICTATSSTHVKTLTDADVQAMAKKVLSDGNLVKVIMRPAKEEAK